MVFFLQVYTVCWSCLNWDILKAQKLWGKSMFHSCLNKIKLYSLQVEKWCSKEAIEKVIGLLAPLRLTTEPLHRLKALPGVAQAKKDWSLTGKKVGAVRIDGERNFRKRCELQAGHSVGWVIGWELLAALYMGREQIRCLKCPARSKLRIFEVPLPLKYTWL